MIVTRLEDMDVTSKGKYVGTEVGRIECSTDWTVDGNTDNLILKYWCGSVDVNLLGTSFDTEIYLCYGRIFGRTHGSV